MTPEPRSPQPTADDAVTPAPAAVSGTRRRRTALTALAATAAAATGVAAAGTFAGAQQDRPTAKAAATTKTTTTPRKATVRVLVKRGLRGKTGARGPKGATGPRGATGGAGAAGADAADVARSLSINWKGAPGGNGSATASVPSIGRLDLTCRDDVQELRLTPARNDLRTVATIDRFQSASVEHERRATTGEPIVVPLPVNGMVTGVFSLEPIGGDGGSGPAPASLTLSSEMKLNALRGDPNDFNFCYVAAQLLQASS